jgi:hypothetical protein
MLKQTQAFGSRKREKVQKSNIKLVESSGLGGVVGMATRLRTGRTGLRIPVEEVFLIFMTPRPGRLWTLSNLHFQWVLVLIPRCKPDGR